MSQGYASAGIPLAPVWRTDWTPTYTNLTIGNGTVDLAYVEDGELIVVRWELTLGSTSTIGTNPLISPPVTMAGMLDNTPLGVATYREDGGSLYKGTITEAGGELRLRGENAGGPFVTLVQLSATVPFTFGDLDEIALTATYQAA